MDYCLEYQYLNDENHLFKEISYDELIHLLDGFETGLVYIGGPWCPNCQAIIDKVNELGKKQGLDVIYNYDTRFENIFKEVDDLRRCGTLEVKLKYYALVEKIKFKSPELVVDTLIPKIHIPFFIAIKNGSCVGYYSIELIREKDGTLHLENEETDRAKELEDNLILLMSKLKEEKRL